MLFFQRHSPQQGAGNHGECVPASGCGPLSAETPAEGKLPAGGNEAGQHPERVPRGGLHIRRGQRSIWERWENQAFLGGICTGEQSQWRAGGSGGWSQLSLPDPTPTIAFATHCCRSHHCVEVSLTQAFRAQPCPRPFPSGPRLVCGLHGPMGEGLPPSRALGAQHP